MDKEKIIKVGYSKLYEVFETDLTCEDFCKLIYREAGYELFYPEQPYINFDDLWEGKFVGNILFLKHKKYGKKKRYSHVGIIFPNGTLLHYSRSFNTERKREVLLTSFDEIFRVYDLVHLEQSKKANDV